MKAVQKYTDLILTDVRDFDLIHIFECGQCFRWDKQADGTYIGVAGKNALHISQNDDCLILHDVSLDEYETFWKSYFHLDYDYSKLKKWLSKDEILNTATKTGFGIRILKQDVWEMIVSFIISASNNIPRIKKIISMLCEQFGEKIEYLGKTYHLFPTPERLALCSKEDLAVIRAGYRDKYIMDAAQKVSSGEIDLDKLIMMDTADAKKMLCQIKGIGNKVADCILLFSLGRHEVFPVDVWIKRVMEKCYFHDEQKISDICEFAHSKFGDVAGFAQQYLFYHARENKWTKE